MSILEELYDGNLEPMYDCLKKTPEISRLSKKIINYEEILQNRLSAKDFETVERLMETTHQRHGIELTQCFMYGWRLCAKFIFDTFKTDYDG